MKITPDKIEIPIPAYFKRERAEELAYWDNLMKETLAKMGVKKQSDETKYMEKYKHCIISFNIFSQLKKC